MLKRLFMKHKSKEEIKEVKDEPSTEFLIKIKYEIMDTGEIIEIDGNDLEAFDKMMTTKGTRLIFD